MKANELRIGNWVKSNKSGNNFKFNSYHFNDLNVILTSYPPKDLLEPIPLTEEWLVKFGFKIFDWGGDLLDYQIGYDGDFILKVGKGYILSKNINYVHQLQNLYFALTGEELEIK